LTTTTSLDQDSRDYLEGAWATHCGDEPPDEDMGFDPSFSVEFERSGGSFYFSDGVDIQVRGRIVSARREGDHFHLEIDYGGTEKDVWRLRLAGTDRLEQLEDTGDAKVLVFKKCERPDRKPVRQLNSKTVLDLTLGKRGGIYFAEIEGEESVCPANPKSVLHFDLIGPAYYSVWRFGDFGDESIQIRESLQEGANVSFSGKARIVEGNQWKNAREGDRTIRVRWLDDKRIRVEPWNASFLRCEN
jgi:hypothetical protein